MLLYPLKFNNIPRKISQEDTIFEKSSQTFNNSQLS